MNINKGFGLLNDSILGHLFCIYFKLYKPVNNAYYFIINKSDSLITALPENLKQTKLCDIKLTLGTETIALLDKNEKLLRLYSDLVLARPYPNSERHIKSINEKIQTLKKLLIKYKVHETPVNTKDLDKIRENKEIYYTLAYVISFSQEQYKKLTFFLKKYLNLYLQKELDGQQNYTLPQLYIDSILQTINNLEYIKIFGQKNIQISKEKNIFFCHSIMALSWQKQIKIRKMLIIDQSVHVTFDNLSYSEKPTPSSLVNKYQYKFENNTLFVSLKDGTQTSLDFEDQRNTKNMLAVFTVLYEHWQKYQDQLLEVVEIERRLINNQKLSADLVNTSDFLSNTISNIRKKIRGKHLEGLINIKRESNAYSLKIKQN